MPEPPFITLARETASPQGLSGILSRISHRPVHALGQNFLIDFNLVEKAIRVVDPDPGLPVVEVGPGLGTLTGALLGHGFRVQTIEQDRRLHAFLEDRYQQAAASGQLTLMQGDAVDHPRASLAAGLPFQVIANLPYAITSPWLEGILSVPEALPQRMGILIQKEAADRLRAGPGSKNFGPMSIFLGHAYRTRDAFKVARRCFHPVPEVDSVFLRLDRLDQPLTFPEPVRRFIRSLFIHRRKQIQGTFRRLGADTLLKAWLDATGIEPHLRPEQVPLPAWECLCRIFGQHGPGSP